jgi:hypothetical protein
MSDVPVTGSSLSACVAETLLERICTNLNLHEANSLIAA